MKNHKFVIDTNILLISISRLSPFHWIYEKIENKEIDLCISNDILTEYREIISKKLSSSTADYVCEVLSAARNVYKTNPHFNWNLITVDPDDNKFADCAIAGNVDYLVTNDKHFNILKSIDFPKVNVINIDDFKKLFK